MKIKGIEVKDDAINRIEAVKSLMDWDEEPKDGDIAYTLSKLPPVNGCAYYDSEIKTCRRSEVPREHGEWEKEVFDLGNHLPLRVAYQCSCCHEFFDSEYNFCPNCGTDMRGKKNE